MGRIYDDDDFDDDDDDNDIRRRRRRRDRDGFGNADIGDSKRMAAGLCGILCGSFGVHKFILGYGLEGSILLSLTISGIILGTVGAVTGFICCLPWVLMVFYVLPMISGTIGMIEGIIYITKSDEEFIEMYQEGRRTWF